MSEIRANGRIAKKYVLRRRIGQGGMGSVWIAHNELTGADVALKVLRPEKGEHVSEIVERFRYEARLGSMLRHRSITRAFDLIEDDDGVLVLVMELLRGETLQSYLATKKTLEAREAIAIAVPILSALNHAHEMGIIHRDVKPGNIYLAVEPDGQVIPKLLDFGIAKVRSSDVHTLEGSVLGTPAYMSPEQIRATRGELTGRSDQFSMGVVLYEMMTGAPPFDVSVPSATLAAVLEAPVDPDPRIPPRVWLEIQRALAKRPNERFESARAMGKALCAALGDETEEALVGSLRRSNPPPTEADGGPPEVVGPSTSRAAIGRRRRPAGWLVGAVAAIFLSLGILTIFALTRTRAEPAAREPAPAAAPAGASSVVSTPVLSVGSAGRLQADQQGPAAERNDKPPPKPSHGHPPPRRPKPIATTPGF